MPIVTIEALEDEIRRIEEESKGQLFLYRGQEHNWPPIPSAARYFMKPGGSLYSYQFEHMVDDLRKVHPAISHWMVNRTFADILEELYPNYSSWFPGSDRELIQFLFQALRQQYSRSAMFLDVSSNIGVALKMGIMSFYGENKPSSDGRPILRARLSDSEYTYLSVFKVPQDSILEFDPNPSNYLKVARYLRGRAHSSEYGLYFALNCSKMWRAKRLVNQSSWFLGYMPSDDYDHSLAPYDFSGAFHRDVLQISTSLIPLYLERRYTSDRCISLYPQDDEVLSWVNNRRVEREFAISTSTLKYNDLGISVYHYFPELDDLYIPI